MRQIGTITDEVQARALEDYLLTLDITTRLVQADSGWQVWVIQEDKVGEARAELDAFLTNPDALRYKGLAPQARSIRKEREREHRRHLEQTFDVRYLWSSRDFRRCPLAWSLIILSLAVTFGTSFGQRDWVVQKLLYCTFDVMPIVEFEQIPQGWVETRDRLVRTHLLGDLRRGELWRLITPIFIHFNWLHLLFNMYWLYGLGTEIEARKKTRRFAFLVIVAALVSNFAQFYITRWPIFGGMSGVDLALFGYIWMKGIYEPELGMSLSRQTVGIMFLYLVFSMYTRMPFAHAAHLSGLFVGIVIALWPHLIDSLRPQAEE